MHDTFRCASAYLLQLLLLAVAVLLDNPVELLGFQARHVSLGGHPSRLLGCPGVSQVPVGCCHALASCLLLLPPFTLVGFGVPTDRQSNQFFTTPEGSIFICLEYLQAVHSFSWCIYRYFIHLVGVPTGNPTICLVNIPTCNSSIRLMYLHVVHSFV